MTKYHIMTPDDGLRYLKKRDAQEEVDLAEFQKIAGKGNTFVDSSTLAKLVSELRKLKKQFPAKLRKGEREARRFEIVACEVVHRNLASFPVDALANMDFWTWLAIAKLADIVEWRYGAEGRHAKLANYGIGARQENFLFRLWLMAELAREEAKEDQYELAKTADIDLDTWRSHIFRQGYANVRIVTKALLRMQAGKLAVKRLSRDGIRELAKRLRRLRANVMFECLTKEQAEALVLELSSDLVAAK